MSIGRSPSSSISSSSQSRLSFISSSSSTFSDVSAVSSLPTPPPTGALKTHAFFSSPFPASPTPTPSFTIPSIDVSTPTLSDAEYSNEPTPRPKQLEPKLSALWPPAVGDDDDTNDDELTAGSIISPPLEQPKPSTALRLLKPLGHGAFSSVWLAYDLSPDPLVLRSRRSLRHLRRQASAKLTSGALSLSLSRAGSLRKLSKRVPGTRPIRSLDHDRLHPSLSRTSSTSSSDSQQRKTSISLTDPQPQPHPFSLSSLADTDAPSASASSPHVTKGRLVAVKMTARGGGADQDKEKERTRVAFVREVEVLRHISHPNITPLLSHLSTETHHVLVLPYLPGGDLLALVNTDIAWSRLRESALQRIWSELCSAVAWMHSVGLVHRDIKLENILLTTQTYTLLTSEDPAPTLDDLPPAPSPLIKLTDFGLSRFVDIRSWEERVRDRRARRAGNMRANGRALKEGQEDDDDEDEDDEDNEEGEADSGPLLSTRCGSEAYAAPELVMGGSTRTSTPPPARVPTPALPSRHYEHNNNHHRAHHNHARHDQQHHCHRQSTTSETSEFKLKPKKSPKPTRAQAQTQQAGVYDARETDAWACGVVLYALVARKLPFGEGAEAAGGGGFGGDGVGGAGIGRESMGVDVGGIGARMARRTWLMRIARGEYEWPEVAPAPPSHSDPGSATTPTFITLAEGARSASDEEDKELMGPTLALSEGAKRIVGKLLVRDPRKRARVEDLWGDVWMGGDGEAEAMSATREDDDTRVYRNGDDDIRTWDHLFEASELGHEHAGVSAMGEGFGEESETMRTAATAKTPGITTMMSEEELEQALEEAEREVDEFGCLVDQDGIDDIARREVV